MVLRILLFLLVTARSFALDFGPTSMIQEDDLAVEGDIFEDYNEDIESTQMMEDERFYRYGRFFTFNIWLGLTQFYGNRGLAYSNDHPTYCLSLHQFLNFQTQIGLGIEFSKHHFVSDNITSGFPSQGAKLVDVNLLRFFWSYRHYIDTSNLGTAITYSNPYFVFRIEYWRLRNKFVERPDVGDETGGGIGTGLGGGLEFPIKLKESYLGLEILYHIANLPDKDTTKYRPIDNNGGYEDFRGNAITMKMAYVFNW
ncbi:MAG: hypothetical protein H6622_09710 [Halobacteriovoraceae bacterium]|nr:hypothetical protein [Halobacteriovoraceae bacterium]